MRRYRVSKLCLGLAAGLALGMALGTFARDDVPTPAGKIDSGLGELAPYSHWRDDLRYATPAAKADSGLGVLPPYTQWREPWLNGHTVQDRATAHAAHAC